MAGRVLIRGVGDVLSAVVHRLFVIRYAVALLLGEPFSDVDAATKFDVATSMKTVSRIAL